MFRPTLFRLKGGIPWRNERTNKYFFNARGTAFLKRIPISRIQRSTTMEYIKMGRIKPWYYKKEQVIGNSITLNFDYNPRPVRLIGTVMDVYGEQTQLKAAVKVYARNEEANIMMWVPPGNPKLKYEVGKAPSQGSSFEHYLDERDRWDEAWVTGRARIQ